MCPFTTIILIILIYKCLKKRFKILIFSKDPTFIPYHATSGSAGYDVYATESKIIPKGKIIPVSTNLHFNIPKGYYGEINARSGLFHKYGIFTFPMTIKDSENIKVYLENRGNYDEYFVTFGDRIAQIIFKPYVERVQFSSVNCE